MPIQEAATGPDQTTEIIDTAMQGTAAPGKLPLHERRAPKGDPDNPSRKELEALAALEAIVPADDLAWNSDEEYFERSTGFPVGRERTAALLTDILEANLTRPEHRAPMQTLARLLRQPGGRVGDPFSSWGYLSSIQPHEAYLAGLHASRAPAAATATATIAPMFLGVEVELIAIGPGDDLNAPNDWAPNPHDDEDFTREGTQRVVVRINDPAGRELAEAFIRGFFGTKSIFMRAPGWKALTEWLPRSGGGDRWLADLARKAPSLRPALTVATSSSGWAIFPAHAAVVRPPDDDQPKGVDLDPLKSELNALVTDLIPVPFTVQVRGANGETRLVRPKGVNDDDPTPGSLIEETVLGDAARADIDADAGGKPARALAALSAAGAEFFNSPNGRSWVSFGGKVHRVSEADGCPAIMAWLVKNDMAPSRTAKTELFDLMAGAAVSGPTHEVHFRQAQTPGAEPVAYLNLMDPQGRGWSSTPLGGVWRPLRHFRFVWPTARRLARCLCPNMRVTG